MRYKVRARELPESALRRIAREAIEEAIVRIEDGETHPHEVVHEVRKICTKSRALLRLFRPAFAEYPRENEFFRDLARSFAELRDATALIECCDTLVKAAEPSDTTKAAIATTRRALVKRRREISSTIEIGDRLGAVHSLLREELQRVAAWSFQTHDPKAVAAGFHQGYRRARRWVKRVSAEPTPVNLHEWRKCVKVHRNHLRVLQPVWPSVLRARHKEVKRLADRLGEEHDLAVLGEVLRKEPQRFDAGAVAVLEEAIDRRRGELQDWVLPEGRRLFAEKPRQVRARMRPGWEAWIRGAGTPRRQRAPRTRPRSEPAHPR